MRLTLAHCGWCVLMAVTLGAGPTRGGLEYLTMLGSDAADLATTHRWTNLLTEVTDLGRLAAAYQRYGVPALWGGIEDFAPCTCPNAPSCKQGDVRICGALNVTTTMHYRLIDGWQAALKHQLRAVRPFIDNGTVSGVFIGGKTQCLRSR